MPNDFYAYEFDFAYSKQMIAMYYTGKGKAELMLLLTGAQHEERRCCYVLCYALHIHSCFLFALEISMSVADNIRNNAIMFGIQQAAKDAAKQGINISTVRYVLFGRY